MEMPIDIQFDTGIRDKIPPCATEYAEWQLDSLRRGHDMARQQLGKAAKRQKRAYQERTREVQFRRGDWVWRSYPQLRPGKLQTKNVGPWLILSRTGEVNYKIQKNESGEVHVVHVDKLARYNPDFGVTLTSWLTDEEGPSTKETQTELHCATPGAGVLKEEEEESPEGQEEESFSAQDERPYQSQETPTKVPETKGPEEESQWSPRRSGRTRREPARYVPARGKRLAFHKPTLSRLCPYKYGGPNATKSPRKLKFGQ